jgi:hypothetical protein
MHLGTMRPRLHRERRFPALRCRALRRTMQQPIHASPIVRHHDVHAQQSSSSLN